ncbi:hypothetical protein AKG11_31385 [Shinella sp. SUS2]|uniref:relaxase/mobilization nuclease domain-containing protein n=1 Tax=unclassified Shinella TaxID=2643062 RepID=UPI00067FE8D3|nr:MULTISPECIES: relaxase/mobilization nuclease domain-containing protein [unclassified Shinella]KNY13056.1 hypothetical protein AKG11_31385 [Shinella sp. SUS2]KOC71778.1 hypothetical protein AKG10_31145 [Shinella sp. GWS1]
MNPVEIGAGKSFKGLAAYILHDVGQAETAERVGWVQSYNLDEASPDRAWRLMAATAMSADQLKEAAGIKKGKPAKNVAYHFSITFNPQEQVSEDVQREAVTGALKALGLDRHQALAASHTDTDHQHVHVMVNLIDPENGFSAASKQPDGSPALMSNTKRKLSKWAQAFEREHGLTVTEGRLANANKRAAGEKVDARRKPRNVYEREKHETTDRRRDFVKRQHDDKARDLTAESRDMHERHRIEWDALKAAYGSEKSAMHGQTGKMIRQTVADTKAEYKPAWGTLFARHRDELRIFERGERSAIGRVWHAAAVFRDRALDGDMLGGFVAAFSKDERRAIVQKKHDREREKLGKQIRAEITQRIEQIRRDQAEAQKQARARFLLSCENLRGDQQQARAAMRERWQEYNADRRMALVTAQSRQAHIVRGQNMGMQRGRGRGMSLDPD